MFRKLIVALFISGPTLASAQQPTNVVLDLSKPAQLITVKLGDVPISAVRACVTPGDKFPITNANWKGAGEVVGSGETAAYHKVWKGSLDEITAKQPAVVVFQHPVQISRDYGSNRYELRDLNIATDFTLSSHGKAAQLEALTWYQMPSGVRKKLTILQLNREQGVLERALGRAEDAAAALPGLRSTLAAARQQSVAQDAGDNVRVIGARAAALGAQKKITKAESVAADAPALKESLAVLPEMVKFCEQLHQRANFGVTFWAEQDGKRIDLKTEPVSSLRPDPHRLIEVAAE